MPKITQKKKGRELFAERLKSIRPYVDFDYDLRKAPTKSQQAKVKRYSDEIAKLTNRPFQVYRPRLRERLRPAQQFSQHETALPGIRVAFVPTDGGKVRLRFTKDGIVETSSHVSIRGVNLTIAGLAGDTADYVARRISSVVASHFTIQAGAFEIPIPYLAGSVPSAVDSLVERYGGHGMPDPEDERENHHWANWLFGLKAYKAEDQDDVFAYLTNKAETIKRDKKARDKQRKRNQRKSESFREAERRAARARKTKH
jgi:hypothetical protein